jgi:polysaccharide lyase-like protein
VATTTARDSNASRFALFATSTLAALALLFVPATLAKADQGNGNASSTSQERTTATSSVQRRGQKSRSRARRKQAQRRRRAHARRTRRADRGFRLSDNSAVSHRRSVAGSSSSDVLDAGFENGLLNWNTAGVGEVLPSVTGDTVRSGAGSGRFALTGSENRSELILGGNGGASANDAVRFHEGDEYYYTFSFYIQSMVYGEPGAHNLIMQFKGTDEGSPYFGLQLWDYAGDDGESGGRGLWSHGEGMDGDRFLSPVAERQWHDVLIHFKASAQGAGFYQVYLNGQLVDSRSNVSMIPASASYAYIKGGLYRNGSETPGTSEIRLDAVRLGPTQSSVLPS